jgi:hypothetical protein
MERWTWWQRLDAEDSVHRVGVLQTTLLAVWTAWVAVGGWLAGVLFLALIPGTMTALSGWFTAAWREERSWSWWVWVVLAGVSMLLGVSGAVNERGWPPYVLLAYGGLVLALLCHPDSRARIDGRAEDRQPSGTSAARAGR